MGGATAIQGHSRTFRGGSKGPQRWTVRFIPGFAGDVPAHGRVGDSSRSFRLTRSALRRAAVPQARLRLAWDTATLRVRSSPSASSAQPTRWELPSKEPGPGCDSPARRPPAARPKASFGPEGSVRPARGTAEYAGQQRGEARCALIGRNVTSPQRDQELDHHRRSRG